MSLPKMSLRRAMWERNLSKRKRTKKRMRRSSRYLSFSITLKVSKMSS